MYTRIGNEDVLSAQFYLFQREKEFTKTCRYACICVRGRVFFGTREQGWVRTQAGRRRPCFVFVFVFVLVFLEVAVDGGLFFPST